MVFLILALTFNVVQVVLAGTNHNQDVPAHHLVGLLNYPNSYFPPELRSHTSGTAKASGDTCREGGLGSSGTFCDESKGPWNDVPSVGYSDIETPGDPETNEKVEGYFWCMSDNGYGGSTNSADYPLHFQKFRLQKEFTYNHGDSRFGLISPYTEAEALGVTLIHDPNNFIKWENDADIQVEYFIPDETWNDWKDLRVLTGRDFDLEGMAVLNASYGIIGDELMPALIPINMQTGEVLGPFVRTPDIDSESGEFNGKFLSSAGDKVHCSISDLEADECKSVDTSVVDDSDYVRHGTSGGYEGLSAMSDGSIVGFIERNAGSTLADRGEPGIRVYKINPDPLEFESFLGFYEFEPGACCIADSSPLPGSSTKIAVAERNNWPVYGNIPGQGLPNNRVCIIDITVKDSNNVFVKNCVFNYRPIDDPFDVDNDGLTTAAFNQWTTEQLMVLDEYCAIAGTDTNYPSTNQFALLPEQAKYFQEVADTRWMFWCFEDAVFSPNDEDAPTTPVASMPAHYLVGLLNYPNAYIPDTLKGHTSGTLRTRGDSGLTCSENEYASGCTLEFGPFPYVPSVGFSDIEFYLNEDNERVTGEFWCTTDNGYGSPSNSFDYPLHIHHMKISKPFVYNHGGAVFHKPSPYTETESMGVTLLHDPNNLIQWENGADIQVAYATPDSTWDDWQEMRVLTGRDFDLEGMAVLNASYAIMGEELMPALFAINPTTGVVLSNFVRTPDIDEDGNFNGAFLSSQGDKVHCEISALEENDCHIVDNDVVDASDYVRHGRSGGYEGLVTMTSGSEADVVAFVESNGGSTLAERNEPGQRVYKITPDPLAFDSFLGFYPFEHSATAIADASPLPSVPNMIAVIERNGFPRGKLIPGQGAPANRICLIDITVKDENNAFVKNCIMHYHALQDPFDVDGDGLTTAAFSQVTTEQLIILDDNCLLAGTDTNFPSSNQFGVTATETPYFQEVSDTRWFIACFNDPVFGDGGLSGVLGNVDSTSWYKNNDPSKDCAWVAEFVPQRCGVKGFDGKNAAEACTASCA